ncbi:unnamed protein product [Calypogeia fissa]
MALPKVWQWLGGGKGSQELCFFNVWIWVLESSEPNGFLWGLTVLSGALSWVYRNVFRDQIYVSFTRRSQEGSPKPELHPQRTWQSSGALG